MRRGFFGIIAAVTASYIIMLSPAPSRGGGDGTITVLSRHLPEGSVFCPLAGKNRRLSDTVNGRPVVIYFTDIHTPADNVLTRALADCQAEYGPWFSWTGVLVGQASPREIEAVRRTFPIRLEDCFHDVDAQWWRELELGPLPAAVVANEDGYVLGRFNPAGPFNAAAASSLLGRTARQSNLEGTAVRDFKLPEVDSEKLVTLFDVAAKDFTFLYFLQTSCTSCLMELQVLERIRGRYPDRVDLVAIFSGSSREGDIRGYLDGGGLTPDHVLNDPERTHTAGYPFDYVPVLLIAGPEGNIVLSREGFRREDAMALASEIEGSLWDVGGEEPRTSFQEARRISAEAYQYYREGKAEMASLFWERALELFPEAYTLRASLADSYRLQGRQRDAAREYGRYLASQQGAYDFGRITTSLRSLAAPSP